MDAKATLGIGDFSRRGKCRQKNNAYDHDFAPKQKLTPFGILLPETSESYLWFNPSKVTADFMADCLEEIWPKLQGKYQPHTLVINLDNGPECSGRRSQWLQRLQDFACRHNITIQLAYYPPYHSKYNPVERLWGILENHWNGELLSTVQKALGLARTMTYKAVRPVVRLVKKIYKTGVKLDAMEKKALEDQLERDDKLPWWFIKITPQITE